jgi:membrane protein YfhO
VTSWVERRIRNPPTAGALLFSLLAAALLAFLFRDGLLSGHVLGQADVLFTTLPWETYRPVGKRIGNPILTDVPTVFYPFAMHARTAILSGQFPVWSSAFGAGEPFFASFQSAVLSPFTALTYVLPFPAGLTAAAAARLFVGGLGMFFFLRALPLSQAAATVGGIAFLLNPFSIVWLEHPLSAAAAWLPWLLLGVESIASRPRRGAIAAFAGAVALSLLAGHPETVFKTFLLVGVYAVYRAIDSGRALRIIGAVAAGAVLGILISSIQLLPFLEYVRASRVLADRGASTQPLFTNPPASFVTAFVPDFYGTPLRRYVLPGTNYCEQQIYPGLVTWVLAVIGILHTRLRGRAMFFLAAAAVAALAMYGTAIARAAIVLLPPLRVAALSRFGLIAIAGIAIAAAIGADVLFGADADRSQHQRRRITAAAAIAAAGVAAIVLAFLFAQADWLAAVRQWNHTLRAVTWSALLLGSAVALALAGIRMSRAPAFILTAALLSIDLVGFADGFHPMLPQEQSFPAVPELEIPQKDPGLFRVAAWGGALPPNTAYVYGLQDFRAFDAIGLRDYTQLLDAGFHFNGATHQLVHAATPHLLDLLNVKYVLTPQEVDLPVERFALIRDGRTRVYSNRRVQPRAFLADEYRVLQGTAALRAMRDADVDLGRVVVLDTQIDAALEPDAATASRGTASIVRYTDDAVAIDTAADGRRLLVLTDVHYPGWRATVDGVDVAILRADYAFRAVAVPPGQHRVEFRYSPATVRYGALLSAAALIVFGLLLLPQLTSSRQRPPTFPPGSPGPDRAPGTHAQARHPRS